MNAPSTYRDLKEGQIGGFVLFLRCIEIASKVRHDRLQRVLRPEGAAERKKSTRVGWETKISRNGRGRQSGLKGNRMINE